MEENIMEEIWKDVVGYEGLYQVSNLGRVKGLPIVTKFGNRLKRHGERLLKPSIGKRGYYVVSLSKNGYASHKTLHRIIASAFIPNPNNYPFIDHIDTNRLNNDISNLRWCTSKENSNNPLSITHQSEATKKKWKEGAFDNRNNLHYIKVAQYRKNGELVKIWDSIIEAAKTLRIDSSSISSVCLGRNKNRHTAGGFVWKHYGEYYMKKQLCTK